MLKETETEETISFFVTFLPFVAFQLGVEAKIPSLPAPATPLADIAIPVCISLSLL